MQEDQVKKKGRKRGEESVDNKNVIVRQNTSESDVTASPAWRSNKSREFEETCQDCVCIGMDVRSRSSQSEVFFLVFLAARPSKVIKVQIKMLNLDIKVHSLSNLFF